MNRVFNFAAGPAMLPVEVLQRAQKELLNWNNTGMSVMELPHRGSYFKDIAAEAEADLREVLNVPDYFTVLFLAGGSRAEFAAVPLNFAHDYPCAAYISTGHWSNKAIDEAKIFTKVHLVADAKSSNYMTIPEPSSWDMPTDAAYLHYVDNETIHGIEFPFVPDSQGLPLIVDMSSNLLSRPVDFSKLDMLYACAQKNCGPAGITIVIVRSDLLERESSPHTPTVLNYAIQAKNNSMLNTPPTFPWYMAGLVFKWVKTQGGVEAMAVHNAGKAQKLYDFIDQSDFYHNPIDPIYRSRMDVRFNLKDETFNEQFIEGSAEAGLTNLKGHRTLGGMRAAIYNAMPEVGVDALIEFMDKFAKK